MSPTLDNPFVVSEWLAERFEECGIDYAIGGAVAMNAYGLIRATNDVDITVYAAPAEHLALIDTLERAGCVFDRERAPGAIARNALLRVRCGKINVDVFINNHPLDAEQRKHRLRLTLRGREAWFHGLEDAVVHKVMFGRPKDAVDLELIFAANAPKIDLGYVWGWVDQLVPPGDPRREVLAELERRFMGA